MSATHFAAAPSRAAVPAAATTPVLDRLAGFFRAWKNRRAVHRLGEMSDAGLADIGLTRADLHAATDVPLGIDPTVRLRAIADERSETIEDAARWAA